MRITFSLLLLLGVLACTGCAGTTSAFDSSFNYRNLTYGYSLPAGAVGASDWLLDNYGRRSAASPLVAKRGADFEYELVSDTNDDGTGDTRMSLPIWDLHYRHRRDGGEMWVSSVPVSSRSAETDLRVLARRYVESAAGTETTIASFAQSVDAVGRTFATRVVSERATSVGGFPAHEVVFEVANVDQLRLDENARWKRTRLILVRPGFAYVPRLLARPMRTLPVVIVLGYSNHPEDFAAHEAEFDALAAQLVFESSDLAPHREAMLACFPDAQSVGFVRFTRGSTYTFVTSPPATAEEQRCGSEALRGYPVTFPGAAFASRAVLRAPVVVPPPTPAAPEQPATPAPETVPPTEAPAAATTPAP